ESRKDVRVQHVDGNLSERTRASGERTLERRASRTIAGDRQFVRNVEHAHELDEIEHALVMLVEPANVTDAQTIGRFRPTRGDRLPSRSRRKTIATRWPKPSDRDRKSTRLNSSHT